jgi:nucleotide-binding universal stress UspA family protein
MTDIQTIVCPVDFSDLSRHALEHAIAIARWYGARLTVVHVAPPTSTLVPPGEGGLAASLAFVPTDVELVQRHLDAFARTAVAAVPGGDGVRLAMQIAEGSTVGEIVRLVDSQAADLLVMATHGRSGFERLVLGSVTEKMLRKSPCPLLTVPPRAEPPPVGVDPFRRILCAVDFSPSSLRALRFAESLAEQADAELAVMHVIEPASVLEPVPAVQPGQAPGAVARAVVEQRLREAIAADARIYSRVTEVIAHGKPYVEILREAGARGSGLIVLGAHGGLFGLPAFGSTTNHVVREASCPVLTVRH